MVDRYTKAVLTVIAFALVVIAAQGAVGASKAQLPSLQRVQICDEITCADVVRGSARRSNALVIIPAQ